MQAICTTYPPKISTHVPPASHPEKVLPLTSHHPTFIRFRSVPQSLHLHLPEGLSPSYISTVTTAINTYPPVSSASASFPPATSSCMSAPLPLVSPLDQRDASTPASDILPPLIDLHSDWEAYQGTLQTSRQESITTRVPAGKISSEIMDHSNLVITPVLIGIPTDPLSGAPSLYPHSKLPRPVYSPLLFPLYPNPIHTPLLLFFSLLFRFHTFQPTLTKHPCP
ncbi:hypothetical protein AMTRI_Chr13g83780 [Amborella trichopoda]